MLEPVCIGTPDHSSEKNEEGRTLTNSPTDVRLFDLRLTSTTGEEDDGNSGGVSGTTNAAKNTSSNKPYYVSLKKSKARHPDCIKHILPKFQYLENCNDDTTDDKKDSNNTITTKSEGASSTIQYRSTRWIRDTVKWRARRKAYLMDTLTQCGCRDCLDEKNQL